MAQFTVTKYSEEAQSWNQRWCIMMALKVLQFKREKQNERGKQMYSLFDCGLFEMLCTDELAVLSFE